MANIQLDFKQLDKWPPYWRCKECKDTTNLLVIEEKGHWDFFLGSFIRNRRSLIP